MRQVPMALPKTGFLVVCIFVSLSAGAQQSLQLRTAGGSATPGQSTQSRTTKSQKLYEIDVEDAIEAGLIEQQLKTKPELLRGRSFFYHGDEEKNELLRRYGYSPSLADPDQIFARTVRVARKGTEQELRELGVTIVLRERGFWVVRASGKQMRLLARLGYQVQPLGRHEPRPRQIRLVVASPEQVAEVGAHRVDIYEVRRTESGYTIAGAAFDDAIDELRALGFKIEVSPYPPRAKP